MPGPSISAYMVEKSSSLTPTFIPSGGDSSRFFNSLASCFITFGGRFSFVALQKCQITHCKVGGLVIYKWEKYDHCPL